MGISDGTARPMDVFADMMCAGRLSWRGFAVDWDSQNAKGLTTARSQSNARKTDANIEDSGYCGKPQMDGKLVQGSNLGSQLERAQCCPSDPPAAPPDHQSSYSTTGHTCRGSQFT